MPARQRNTPLRQQAFIFQEQHTKGCAGLRQVLPPVPYCGRNRIIPWFFQIFLFSGAKKHNQTAPEKKLLATLSFLPYALKYPVHKNNEL
jgi:hypothetical protein